MRSFCLVALRTLVGWHFAYEGYYKLMQPGWSRDGGLVAPFSAAGYLKSATGPLAGVFHWTAAHPSLVHATDLAVPIGLLLVGLSLMLGLLTQIGCAGAIAFLTLFYVSQPPLSGMPQAGAEGAYLFVNKNLIELAAVATVMAFRTGAIAGLDRVVSMRTAGYPAAFSGSDGLPSPQPPVGVAGVPGQRR
jgi:thiosulfate dehydrogenase (quinone) large subunit